jgi:ribosomal protein S18 acetylase RimI-like enzyme
VYDEGKTVVGAISGYDNFGQAEIGGLWVQESLRGMGYGRALLEKAEEWGKNNGCKNICVFTIKQWNACSWYQSRGFTIEFERLGHANDTVGCYLIKSLKAWGFGGSIGYKSGSSADSKDC